MIPECQPYADSLAALHSQLAESIEGLGTDALDWTPAPGANGLAVIVAHAMGSERFLIGQTVGGIDAHRDRDAEFSLRGVDVELPEAANRGGRSALRWRARGSQRRGYGC